jgi:hypothetical protein
MRRFVVSVICLCAVSVIGLAQIKDAAEYRFWGYGKLQYCCLQGRSSQ